MSEKPSWVTESEINSKAFDKWSFVHGTYGLAFGLFGVRPVPAIATAVVYDVAEWYHEWPRGSIIFGSKGPESPANIAGDMVAFTTLYALGRALSQDPRSKAAAVMAGLGATLLGLVLMKHHDVDEP